MRNQPPVHEPTLVAAPMPHDYWNVGRSLGGDVEAWHVL